MEHFNQLSPAKAERLALLLEEMGEAQQAIGKVLRHGYASAHPNGGPNNRAALAIELGHVRFAIADMTMKGDIDEGLIGESFDSKAHSVTRYMHHQPNTRGERTACPKGTNDHT